MLAMIVFLVLIAILILILWLGMRSLTMAERILAVFIACCADVVLVMELAGLLGVFNRPVFVVLFQLLISLAGGILAWRKGLKFSNLRQEVQIFWRELKAWPFRLGVIPGVFLILVLLNYLLLSFVTVRFPQNVSDPLYNHLSRIGFWIQQGSLAHYNGFSLFGMIYPYNNSLLMSPPVLFLQTARFAGLVQFLAAVFGALAVYLISLNLGFKRKGSFLAGLVFLTYPVIIFESITAQNDLLAACFNASAFAFLLLFIKKDRFPYLLLSAASIALAIGTNQSGLLVLPGYFLLILYMLIRKKASFNRVFARAVVFLSTSVLLLGSYSYIQNFVGYGNFVGPQGFLGTIVSTKGDETVAGRIGTNSVRLFTQFISCDGMPASFESRCIQAKTAVLRPILGRLTESNRYLYGEDPFTLSAANVQNCESAWYGPISWLLILPATLIGVIAGIRRKSPEKILLILGGGLFFIAISFIKHGWDPYQGRYLITSVILLQPFAAVILEPRGKIGSVITILIGLITTGIMVYSTISNANLPLVSRRQLDNVYSWGVSHSFMPARAAVRFEPIIRADLDVWNMSPEEVATLNERSYLPALTLVNENVPSGSSLGIVADTNLFFDFLFRGREVRNRLFPHTAENLDAANEDFVLIPSTLDPGVLFNYSLIGMDGNWALYSRIQ